MSNTILTAKNTFGDGLVLDISPENTGANNLSSALNATLITANGNEMTLQNDMGNARVETAYLPDGYIPIGTCEFGDIIYIVSYNPLVNKAQIGCFPSPERNISSEEVSGLSQLLSSTDFQVLDINGNPTGELKTMQVKKTLFDGKLLRPGDKYLIYTTNNNFEFFKHTSQYGTMGEDFPKLVKLRVASVDTEGKLTYLDSTTKWYEGKEGMESYFIAYMNKSGGNKVDIDSYRNLIDSAYSVFQNKNAGTLTLIAELETIDTFSCAYSVLKKDGIYQVFLHPSWASANDNISIDGIRIEGNRADFARVEVLTEKGFEWHNMDQTYTYELTRSYEPEYKDNTYNYFKNNNYNTALSEQLYWDRFSTNSLNSIIQTESGIIHNVEDLEKSELDILNSKATYMYKAYEHVDIPEEIKQCFNSVALDNINLSTALLYTFCKLIVGTSVNMIYVIYKNTYYSIYRNPEVITTPLSEITTISLQKLAMTQGYKSLYYPNLQSYKNNKYYTVNNQKEIELTPNTINSDVINYKFNKEDTLSVLRVKSGSNNSPIDNFIWNITVYPRMPYGYLKHLGIPLTIDFSKVGDNTIELIRWKYYNEGHLSTLTYGFNTNLAPNYKVTKVTFEFFDDKGLVATYTSNEKISYNGIFTERFGLNGENLNYKLSARDLNGQPINRPDGLNDAGILYSNMLYGVRILVHYGTTNELGQLITSYNESFHRWYWTNNMFNDKYYQENDFNYKNVKLAVSCNYKLESNSDFETKQVAYYNKTPDINNLLTTLGADVSYTKGDLNLSLNVGLQKDYNYNTFVPMEEYEDEEKKRIKFEVPCKIGIGHSKINQSYKKIGNENGNESPYVDKLMPSTTSGNNILENKSNTLLALLGKDKNPESNDEIWDNIEPYKSQFNLSIVNPGESEDEEYQIDDNTYKVIYQKEDTLVSGEFREHKLSLEGISFDKVMQAGLKQINEKYFIIRSLWDDDDYRGNLGITEYSSSDKTPWNYFNTVVVITMPTNKQDGELGTIFYNNPMKYDDAAYVNYTNKVIPKNTNCTYNNEHLLQALQETGVKGPFILLCWSVHLTAGNSNEQEQFILGNEHIFNKKEHYSAIFNLGTKDHKTPKGAFFQLALYKPMEYVYLLNDVFWYNETTNNTEFAQVYNGQNRTESFKDTDNPKLYNKTLNNVDNNAETTEAKIPSIASFVTELSKNIYYQSSDTSDQSYTVLSGISGAQDFQENWEQHILVSTTSTANYSKSIKLIGSEKSLYDYMQSIRNNLEKLPQLVFNIEDNTQIITLKFNVPEMYLLKDTYTRKGQSPLAIWSHDKGDTFVYKDYSNELLYVKNGELQILDKDFEIFGHSNPNLVNLIQKDSSQLIGIHLYPGTNKYKLGSEGSESRACYYQNASKDATITGYYNDII